MLHKNTHNYIHTLRDIEEHDSNMNQMPFYEMKMKYEKVTLQNLQRLKKKTLDGINSTRDLADNEERMER